MSAIDSVVLITSSDPKSTNFGTGFIVHQDRTAQASYVVTCAHVIRDVGKEAILVDDLPATLVAFGDPDPGCVDLAVVRVEGLLDRPCLGLQEGAKEKASIFVPGNQQGSLALQSKPEYVLRSIDGTLGQAILLKSKGGLRVPAWDLLIQDIFALKPGYSGSPVVDAQTNCVMGVVRTRSDEGQKGTAISIECLRSVWEKCPVQIRCVTKSTASEPLRIADLERELLLCDRVEVMDSLRAGLQAWNGVSPAFFLLPAKEDNDARLFFRRLVSHGVRLLPNVVSPPNAAPAPTGDAFVNAPCYNSLYMWPDDEMLSEPLLKQWQSSLYEQMSDYLRQTHPARETQGSSPAPACGWYIVTRTFSADMYKNAERLTKVLDYFVAACKAQAADHPEQKFVVFLVVDAPDGRPGGSGDAAPPAARPMSFGERLLGLVRGTASPTAAPEIPPLAALIEQAVRRSERDFVRLRPLSCVTEAHMNEWIDKYCYPLRNRPIESELLLHTVYSKSQHCLPMLEVWQGFKEAWNVIYSELSAEEGRGA